MTMRTLRRAWIATLLSLALVGPGGPSVAQEWQEYRPADVGYRVEFPGTPRPITRTVQSEFGTVTVTVAAVAQDAGAFMTNHMVMPREILQIDPQTVLDSGRDSALANVKGQLREERRLSLDGAPARRLVIDMPPNKVSLVLAVLKGTMLYQAVYVGYAGKESGPEVERFLGSFRLVTP